MKSVALLSAQAPDAVAWLLDHAAQAAGGTDGPRRVAIQVGVADLAGQPPRYDAVLEIWHEAHGVADALIASLAGRFAVELYLAEEVVAKPAAVATTAGISPGIASLSFIRAKPALSHTEASRHWCEHAPLACEIHWGMTRYIQNRFDAGEQASSGWFGMAHLHFPDAETSRDGLFRTAEDRTVIGADVAEFVEDHVTMLAVEHVIRA